MKQQFLCTIVLLCFTVIRYAYAEKPYAFNLNFHNNSPNKVKIQVRKRYCHNMPAKECYGATFDMVQGASHPVTLSQVSLHSPISIEWDVVQTDKNNKIVCKFTLQWIANIYAGGEYSKYSSLSNEKQNAYSVHYSMCPFRSFKRPINQLEHRYINGQLNYYTSIDIR